MRASLALALLLTASTVTASPIVFTDRAQWVEAVGSYQTDDTVFHVPDPHQPIDANFGAWDAFGDMARWDASHSYVAGMSIQPDVRGFAFDAEAWMTGATATADVDLTLTIDTISTKYRMPSSGFFGMILDGDSVAWASFWFNPCEDCRESYRGIQISNLAVAKQSVPEPGSLALLGLGLAGLVALRRT